MGKVLKPLGLAYKRNMGKTHRRPPIRQHQDMLEDQWYTERVEKNKKNMKKNKHPKRIIEEEMGAIESPFNNGDEST